MSLLLDSDVSIPTVSPSMSLLSGLQQVTSAPPSTLLGNSGHDSKNSILLSLGNDTQTANSSSTSMPSDTSFSNMGMHVPASKGSLAVCAVVLFSMLSSL